MSRLRITASCQSVMSRPALPAPSCPPLPVPLPCASYSSPPPIRAPSVNVRRAVSDCEQVHSLHPHKAPASDRPTPSPLTDPPLPTQLGTNTDKTVQASAPCHTQNTRTQSNQIRSGTGGGSQSTPPLITTERHLFPASFNKPSTKASSHSVVGSTYLNVRLSSNVRSL